MGTGAVHIGDGDTGFSADAVRRCVPPAVLAHPYPGGFRDAVLPRGKRPVWLAVLRRRPSGFAAQPFDRSRNRCGDRGGTLPDVDRVVIYRRDVVPEQRVQPLRGSLAGLSAGGEDGHRAAHRQFDQGKAAGVHPQRGSGAWQHSAAKI
ncbi:hypothetical protein D3C76_1168000 [compost metagenome]